MPEIIRHQIDGDSVYAIWEITETVEELLGMISLRPSEQSLFDSFVVGSRKKQWLAYRILIRSLLSPRIYQVEYDEAGKPFLAGSHYHISVTHSGDLAGVIISSAGLAGIDIEKVRPKIEKVADRFMHPDEIDRIAESDRTRMLTMAWCAKEALYKMYGRKNLDFKEHIRLRLPDDPDSGQFRGKIQIAGNSREYLLVNGRHKEYVLVYVLDSAVQDEAGT
jgi:phosphopantetheinyl transferase